MLLDGAPVAPGGGALTIAARARTCCARSRATAAGNETVAERSLGVDASAPVDRRRDAPTSWRARCGSSVADALSGVALVEVRLAGTALETRLAADGRTAVARVPAGRALDGAAVDVRVIDASSPANVSERA